MDAAVYYRRNNWKVALKVKNLLDTEYVDNATDRIRITPGTPLTLVGSVSLPY